MDKWDGESFIDALELSNDKKVLEIGIGKGRLAIKTAPHCLKLCGIDISQKTITRAKENLSDFENIELICSDFLEYEFKETFDIVYSSLTSMHFKNKQEFIGKAFSLLNDNSRFVLSIDKNQSDCIDMGTYKLKVYPDTPDKIISYINSTGMSFKNQFETEFAYVFVCVKKL